MVSCSSDNVIEEIRDITESTDPMRFSGINNQNQVTRTDPTIPNLLQQNFMVSTYKNFGTANQQTVMPMYEVNYEQYTASNGEPTSWNYISSDTNHQFYQTQYEKYWDYSAFPYRFHAVSPAPVENGQLTPGFILSDTELNIPTKFILQTSKNGLTTEGRETCMVSQVERKENGRDYDLLDTDDDGIYPKEINSNGGLSKTRSVALPFHHLGCKVRFAIYVSPEVGEGDSHKVLDVKIKVKSSDFVTAAKYKADLSSGTAMEGSFYDKDTSSDGVTLLEIESGANQTGNDLYLANQRSNAYWFECKDGIMQIPQKDVQLTISCLIEGRFEDENLGEYIGEYTEFKDVPIVMKDTHQDSYTWEMNTIYTYYIIVSPFRTTDPIYPIGNEELQFTCTVEPWIEVTGSLDTGLED